MRYIFALALLAVAAPAQKFEVASIKPNASNDHRVMMRMAPGGRINMTGVTARQLMAQAFNVRDFQITGGPAWMGTDQWDIQAKAEEGAGERPSRENMQAMMRNLLIDRFGLKVREESKEAAGYALLPGKGGPKLKASEAAGSGPRGMVRMGRGMINAQGADMAMLVQQLSQQLGKPVIDKTGLEGRYDVELRWTPEPGQGLPGVGGPPPPDAAPPADNNGPTIFTAVQEQLGLRLESQKTTVPVYIVEAISKPSEN